MATANNNAALNETRDSAAGDSTDRQSNDKDDGSFSTRDDIEKPDDIPNIDKELPSIKLYSHAPIFYWWPVWLTGFILAGVSIVSGRSVTVDEGSTQLTSSSTPGLIFVTVMLLVIIFTNIRLRGIYSVATIMGAALIAVSLAWFGWWDEILGAIPELSVHMNTGFYFVFSTALFLVWASFFFFFDRLAYWRVRPGQMTEERLIGDLERSYDTRGMLFEKKGEDFFRHKILGLGAGDLGIITTGARKQEINLHNVLRVDRKVTQIQKLIMVQPDDLIEKPTD